MALVRHVFRNISKSSRFFSSKTTYGSDGVKLPSADEYKNPWKMIKDELSGKQTPVLEVPRETDVVIIGGGVMGSSVAYWLKQRNPEGISVTVIEKDPNYTQASTVLSVGGIRQQFSLPENIEMSLYGADFLRKIRQHLTVGDMDPPDIQYNPHGYLFLASKEGAECLKKNYDLQLDLGAKTELLTKTQIKDRWPWMNVDDIELGTFGIENEGWFDPWSLLVAFRNKAISVGVRYIKGEVIEFQSRSDRRHGTDGEVEEVKTLQYVNVKRDDNTIHPVKFAYCVNAAGPDAGRIAELAGIGNGKNELAVGLPVKPRKRFVYVLHAPNGPGLHTPMVCDPSGIYFRREGLGGTYICGRSPEEDCEPKCDDLAVDYEFFNNEIWPGLAHRCPSFEAIKIRAAWAGFYDYNTVDQNLVIGNHPYFRNFFFVNGSSGHGIQHSPAIGRAMMELIYYGEYKTINLERFSFDRFLYNEPIFEQNIV